MKETVSFLRFYFEMSLRCTTPDLDVYGGGQHGLDVAQQLVGLQEVRGGGVLQGQVALHRVRGTTAG